MSRIIQEYNPICTIDWYITISKKINKDNIQVIVIIKIFIIEQLRRPNSLQKNPSNTEFRKGNISIKPNIKLYHISQTNMI